MRTFFCPPAARWFSALTFAALGACSDGSNGTSGFDAAAEGDERDAGPSDEPEDARDAIPCGTDCAAPVPADAGRDASATDAGRPLDASSAPDAGVNTDTGTMDATQPVDAATASDGAKPGGDAIAADANTLPDADAGGDASTDAAAPRSVTIRFKAEVSGQDFACGRSYPGQGSTAVEATPTDFRFFVQDLRLIDALGADVPVRMDERAPWQTQEVALVDFEDGQGSCFSGNEGTNHIITGSVPAGHYVGVAFRNGIPPELNHGNPATAPAPLKNAPGTLWSWQAGYKFLIAELQQVVSSGQIPGFGLVHVGSSACTGNAQQGAAVTCARSNRNEIRLGAFDPELNQIVVDLGTIHAGTDISQDSQCHSAGTTCPAPFAALGVNFGTGQLLATFPAFRVR